MNINPKAEYYWLKMVEVVPENKRFQFEDDAARMIKSLHLDKDSQERALRDDIYNEALEDILDEVGYLRK